MTLTFRRPLRLAAALALLTGIAACDSNTPSEAAGSAKSAAAPAKGARDWTTLVAATPEGGYRIGNPDARVKLVEYGSIWCPHCREFHEKAMAALKRDFIATGNVSYELRSFVLNGPDLAATLLVRCGGQPTFYRFVDTFYARQQEWQQKFIELPQSEIQRLQALPQDRQMLEYADAAGLDDFVKPQGVTKARFQQCLTNKAEIDRLTAMNNEAITKFNVQGTPTFIINGQKVDDVSTWEALEPKLRAAL